MNLAVDELGQTAVGLGDEQRTLTRRAVAEVQNRGHHLGRAAGLGYVNDEDGVTADWVKEGTYEIEVACERFPAQASLRPMYDPKAERVKV